MPNIIESQHEAFLAWLNSLATSLPAFVAWAKATGAGAKAPTIEQLLKLTGEQPTTEGTGNPLPVVIPHAKRAKKGPMPHKRCTILGYLATVVTPQKLCEIDKALPDLGYQNVSNALKSALGDAEVAQVEDHRWEITETGRAHLQSFNQDTFHTNS